MVESGDLWPSHYIWKTHIQHGCHKNTVICDHPIIYEIYEFFIYIKLTQPSKFWVVNIEFFGNLRKFGLENEWVSEFFIYKKLTHSSSKLYYFFEFLQIWFDFPWVFVCWFELMIRGLGLGLNSTKLWCPFWFWFMPIRISVFLQFPYRSRGKCTCRSHAVPKIFKLAVPMPFPENSLKICRSHAVPL